MYVCMLACIYVCDVGTGLWIVMQVAVFERLCMYACMRVCDLVDCNAGCGV